MEEDSKSPQELKVVIFDTSKIDLLGLLSDLGKLSVRFLFGLIDSLRIDYVVKLWRQDPAIRPVLLSCFFLNAAYCVFMIAAEFGLDFLWEQFSYASADSSALRLYASIAWVLLYMVYNAIWTIPVFAATFLRSNNWYSELAKIVPSPITPVKVMEKNSNSESTIISQISDSLSFALQLMFLKVLTSAFAAIPYTGWHLSAVLQCLLASYYAFESHWMRSHPGQASILFISFIERDYAYFLGFGVLLTALTINLPVFMSLALYAGILPIFIVVAGRPEAAAWQRSSTKPTLKVLPTAIKYFDLGHKCADLITIWLKSFVSAPGITSTARQVKFTS